MSQINSHNTNSLIKIKQIDILVHPDYLQMDVPHLPIHQQQLFLRMKWDQRVDLLEKQQDAILLYFSYITRNKIKQGLQDLSVISNKIERLEIERISRFTEKLGNRFILFGWFEIPGEVELKQIFKDRGFTYDPNEVKVYSYGEIFEMCMQAWSYHATLSLGIPSSNIQYSRENSLTKEDCTKINNWRINNWRNQSCFLL